MTAIPGNLLSYNTESIETDATGWGVAVNCAASRQTTQHLDGAASLRLVSTAAGAMSVRTASAVAIPAGTQYVSFGTAVFSANLLAAQVSVQWLDASLSVITTTSNPFTPTSATAFTYGHSGVTVPDGAVSANIFLQCTATAASQTVYFDRTWIVPQPVWAGQLLPLDAEFNETPTPQWTAVSNCSVSVGPIGTYFPDWGTALKITATAAGDVRIAPASDEAAAVPVTPGVEYMATAWVAQASGATRTVLMEIEWLAPDGVTYLSSSLNDGSPAVSAEWCRVVTIGTCPPGAGTARLRPRPQAGAAGETWYMDQVGLVPTSNPTYLIPGNLLGYNTQDMEMDASGWAAVSGCSLSTSSAEVFSGGSSLAIAMDGSGPAVIQLAEPVPVSPGTAYECHPEVYWPGSPSGYTLALTWLTDTGATVKTMSQDWDASALTPPTWVSGATADLCPPTATHLQVTITIGATSATTWYMDHVYVGPGGLAAIATEIEGQFAAQIAIQGLTTSSATTWNLNRVAADGSMTPVRGQDGDLAGQTVVGDVEIVDDFEAPLGVPIQYYVLTSGGPGGGEDAYTTTPITLTSAPLNTVIIKDPGLPARSTTSTVQTLPDWTRTARQGVNQVRGRANPIVISDVRTSRTGTLTLVTETAQEVDALWWLLETGSTLLLQWPSTWGERDVYVQVGDVDEAHVVAYAEYGDRTWSLPLTEVDRPVGGIVGSPGRTWQSVLDEATSWSAESALYPTWLGVLVGVVT